MRGNEKHQNTVTAGFVETAKANATIVSNACRRGAAGIFSVRGGMKLKPLGCRFLWYSTRTDCGVHLAFSPRTRLQRFQIDVCVGMAQIENCNLMDATLCCASSRAAAPSLSASSLADVDRCWGVQMKTRNAGNN